MEKKSRLQLIRISAAVCGIELCYAAETAFVSPVMLRLGVPVIYMTFVWSLSPFLGFFLVPFLGSMSDRCRSRLGRRRPFIIALSIGIVFGLFFIPHGEKLGVLLGDRGSVTAGTNGTLYTQHNDDHTIRREIRSTIVNNGEQGNAYFLVNNSYITNTTIQNKLKIAQRNEHDTLKPFPLSDDIQSKLTLKRIPPSKERQSKHPLPPPTRDPNVLYSYGVYDPSYYDVIDSPVIEGSTLPETTTISKLRNIENIVETRKIATYRNQNVSSSNSSEGITKGISPDTTFSSKNHVIGIALIVIGVVMLDFNCDACQSPCRAYLLDVSIPADHAAGLTTFTIMAGVGGSLGYLVGGINWHGSVAGFSLTDDLQIVFSVVLVAFVICLALTLTSFRETPLSDLNLNAEVTQHKKKKTDGKKYRKFSNEDDDDDFYRRSVDYGSVADPIADPYATGMCRTKSESDVSKVEDGPGRYKHRNDSGIDIAENGPNYQTNKKAENGIGYDGTKTVDDNSLALYNSDNVNTIFDSKHQNINIKENSRLGSKSDTNMTMGLEPCILNEHGLPTPTKQIDFIEISTDVTLKTYLLSIVRMPRSIFTLCLTNLFCWMSLVCYSLFFTDFVGQCVFGGDPMAPRGSQAHILYEDGVRMGSWGMALYSLSCSGYSLIIDSLIKRWGTKPVYICSQLVYTVGMTIMAITRTKAAVIVLSTTAGVMYATLFTLPYLIVANYHTSGQFAPRKDGSNKHIRGLGTDVALVSSMVFLAQFLLSLCMGSLIHAAGSSVAVVVAAAVLSLCGALSASQVVYLDL